MRIQFKLFWCLVLVSCCAFAADIAVPVTEPTEADVVSRYLSAAQEQQSVLRGVSMEVDIDARIPRLKQQGKLHALRQISRLGKITYRMLGFSGDNSVKKEVIARYLSAEVQGPAGRSISITPENYKFHLKGLRSEDGQPVYVLALSPRRKQVGLFKGELWLDPSTCMPVRESGRFVKNPSIFLKRMEFVRSFAVENGVAIPQKVESLVKTRIFGPVELNINFSNISSNGDNANSGSD